MSIESLMPSNHLIRCRPLLLLSSVFPNIRVFSNESALQKLEFQLQHQSFNEHPERISFRMDWLDFLSTQGTLKSLLQHHSSKTSILPHSAFFIVHLYILWSAPLRSAHWMPIQGDPGAHEMAVPSRNGNPVSTTGTDPPARLQRVGHD